MAQIYRIYTEQSLSHKKLVILDKASSHHLCVVLRLKNNANIRLFNELGEWNAKIIVAHKLSTKVEVLDFIRHPVISDKKVNLFFCPLKNTCSDFIITKATELGVHSLTQVISQFTVNKPVMEEKIKRKLKDAAQQCGRLTLPLVNSTVKLKSLLETNNATELIWLNEKQNGIPLQEYIMANANNTNLNLLIGPEGGFSTEENLLLTSNEKVTNVFLKGNTLRAETAAIVALSLAIYL